MPLTIHSDSHLDHGLPEPVRQALPGLFTDRAGFFIATVDLRTVPGLEAVRVPVALVGPANGDKPVPEYEVEYRHRGGRGYNSRMLKPGYNKPRNTHTTLVTVIAGPRDGQDCVLYTAFGGPLAPKEPDDPTLAPADREASVAFWKDHALADNS